MLIGFPGTLLVGATALGTAPAFMLFLIASRYYFHEGQSSRLKRSLIAGVLFGLAAATRMDLVMFAPALVIHAFLFPRTGRMQSVVQSAAVCAIGVALLVVNQQVHVAFNAVPPVNANLASSTGVSGILLDYPRLLNKVLIASSLMPFGLMVGISLLVFYRFRDKPDRNWQTYVLCYGCIAWLAWVLRAPIPHLRYLWPGLAAFAVLLGVNLARVYQQDKATPWVRLCCIFLAIGFATDGVATTFRHLVCGQSDIVSWEYSREVGLDYYRRFQQRIDEDSIATYLSELPTSRTLFAAGPPFRYRYLFHEPCFPIDQTADMSVDSEPILLLGPEVGTYLYLRPDGYRHIQENGTLMKEIGEYSVYRMDDINELAAIRPFSRASYYAHPHSSVWFGIPK